MAEGDKPTSKDRPFWSLSPEDHHALWVNFIGTVASALVIAAILGGAITLARAYKNLSVWTLLPAALLLPLVALIFFRASTPTKEAKEESRGPRLASLAIAWLFTLLAVFYLLVLIGRAAGIK